MAQNDGEQFDPPYVADPTAYCDVIETEKMD